MKIYFIRHGEAVDDIENRYGGWADYSLTEKGIQTAQETGKKLKSMGIEPEIILTSPFVRARRTAEEISKILELPIEDFQYLKERNTYGLLCGVKKEEAKEKYPDLVEAHENDKPVYGYEPYDFFLARVKRMIEILSSFDYKTIICVTHGKLLKALLRDIIGKKAKEMGDNCIVEIELDSNANIQFLTSEGIIFE